MKIAKEDHARRLMRRPKLSAKAAAMPLSTWVERVVRLPAGTTAEPGRIKLWPYQRGIADAFGDPLIERVSVIKSARVGYTALLTSLIANHVVRDPAPILCLLPTQADCRDFMVSDIETLFENSPALAGKLFPPATAGRSDRNTLLHRLYRGGSLKVVAGKAPRNLRRHTARILLIDECDAIEVSAEGDPITLAEKRTLSFANRKIILGSTPLDEGTSHVMRAFGASDQRVFEVPCPQCGAFQEVKWADIEWPEGRPESAAYRCPSCKALIDESHKAQMVERGQWRATRPDIKNHAGFRINSLVSLLPNASWCKLAPEFLRAKDDSTTLRVFLNTVLAEPWREQADEVDENELLGRVEPFDLDHIPPEILAITIGVDTQDDRLECSIVGHARDGTVFVLSHEIIWGSPLAAEVWTDLDALLHQRWRHPHGGTLRADACLVDAGDGGHYDAVLSFCNARLGRKVLAGKGQAGFARPAILPSKTKRGKLFIVGVDVLKTQIVTRLARGRTIRFSHVLDAHYFEMLASERRIVRMSRGRPVARFERKVGARAESLDCLAYALAAKAALSLSGAAFDQREDALRSPTILAPPAPSVIRSRWMERP
jgi:phage terminase large subunit GpA-like protein